METPSTKPKLVYGRLTNDELPSVFIPVRQLILMGIDKLAAPTDPTQCVKIMLMDLERLGYHVMRVTPPLLLLTLKPGTAAGVAGAEKPKRKYTRKAAPAAAEAAPPAAAAPVAPAVAPAAVAIPFTL